MVFIILKLVFVWVKDKVIIFRYHLDIFIFLIGFFFLLFLNGYAKIVLFGKVDLFGVTVGLSQVSKIEM